MRISYLTPYSQSKNFGQELNERISDQKTDWICLTDSDACFLTPRYGNQIYEVCQTTEFDLIGCITNRLGRPIQRHTLEMCNNWDMSEHYKRAKQRELEHWGVVDDITDLKFVAGMFMLFRKSLWDQIKFKENCITWDDQFSSDVRSIGGKLGLMKGLYMFHFYRGWADFPMFANQHLVNK